MAFVHVRTALYYVGFVGNLELCTKMDLRISLVILMVAHSAIGLLPQLHQVHSKFQFKHSFKGPHLVDSKGNIPFWSYGGSKCSKFIRLFVTWDLLL